MQTRHTIDSTAIQLLFVIVAIACIGRFDARAQSEDTIDVDAGQAVILAFLREIRRASVVDRNIAVNAIVTKNWLNVTGKQSGVTSLTVEFEDGSQQVYSVAVSNETGKMRVVRAAINQATILRASEEIGVVVDQAAVVQIANLKQVFVSDRDVADVQVTSPKGVIVIGKKPGTTTLMLFPEAGKQVQMFCLKVGNEAAFAAIHPKLNEAVTVLTATEDVRLSVGKSVTLQFGVIQRVALASPRIADAQVISRTEIRLTGKETGVTTVIVGEEGDKPWRMFRVEVVGSK